MCAPRATSAIFTLPCVWQPRPRCGRTFDLRLFDPSRAEARCRALEVDIWHHRRRKAMPFVGRRSSLSLGGQIAGGAQPDSNNRGSETCQRPLRTRSFPVWGAVFHCGIIQVTHGPFPDVSRTSHFRLAWCPRRSAGAPPQSQIGREVVSWTSPYLVLPLSTVVISPLSHSNE